MVFLEKMSKVLFGLPEAEIKQMTILTCWAWLHSIIISQMENTVTSFE